jgi:hypothetical protein
MVPDPSEQVERALMQRSLVRTEFGVFFTRHEQGIAATKRWMSFGRHGSKPPNIGRWLGCATLVFTTLRAVFIRRLRPWHGTTGVAKRPPTNP